MLSPTWRAVCAGALVTAFLIVLVPSASAQVPAVAEDDFEGTTWTEEKTGGASFVAASTSGQTENAFRTPRRSMEISFTSGGSGTDYGTVLRWREFTVVEVQMLRVWFYAERYSHDGNVYWDNLDAGVRLRLYDGSGANYATVQYWLAAWFHDTDTKTPDANSRLIYGRPPMNHWTEFVGFPETDFPAIDWGRATRVRVQLYAMAAGTFGDQFMMYFDAFSYGSVTSKVTYVWTGTLQADQVLTDCREVSFTVPGTAVYVKASLSIPPANSDFDLSVWDNQGRRTGGWTRADRMTRTDIPGSTYNGAGSNPETVVVNPPSTFGTWRAGCTLFSGNGHYELRVDVYVTETLTYDTDSTQYWYSVEGPASSVSAEARFGTMSDFDLSVFDAAGHRTGGWTHADHTTRTDILYSTYSGYSVNPEWVSVDPPVSFGLWRIMAYGYAGTGYYELEVHIRVEANFWSINLQDGDVGGNIATARNLFDQQLVPLGVAHVRTDFPWSNIEPSQDDAYNWPVVDFYRFYAAAAQARGMDVVVILGHVPQWAKDIYNGGDHAGFFGVLQEYCTFVGQEVGAYVDHYQIGNEENFDVPGYDTALGIVSTAELPTASQACMTGLLAGEVVGATGHQRALKTAVNVAAQWLDWSSFLRNWVNGAPASVDVIAIDHYPGTKPSGLNCELYTDWAPLTGLMGLAQELNKEAAIMELGAAWKGGCRANTEVEQAKFAYEASSAIYDLVVPNNRDHPRNRVLMGSWYEIIDPPEDWPCPFPQLDYECNFGIISSAGWVRKLAWGVLQAKIADWGRWSLPPTAFTYGLTENQGGGVALANMDADPRLDAIFMALDNPSGENYFYYRVGWNLNADGTATSWTPASGLFGPYDAGGWDSQGGGVAIADVNRNGIMDALFLNVNNPPGDNDYRYRIAFDMIPTGVLQGQFTAWTNVIGGPSAGTYESQGGGVSFGDVDRNGVLDAIFMTIASPVGPNDFRYLVGWNVGTTGLFASWSPVKSGGSAMSDVTQGGGVALTDWDGDGQLDLLLMCLDNPTNENDYRFKVGLYVNTLGDVAGGWSTTWGYELVPSWEEQGADLAAGDINLDGRSDLLFMAVDNPSGNNDFRYRVRLAL